MATVLLVSRETVTGDAIADELEARGHDVMLCPGPQAPRFTCPGARCERCALSAAADVVVLDGWLAPDEARRGVPSWHLALYYRAQGLPVIVLIGPDALPGPVPDDSIVPIRRGADPADIANIVEDQLVARRLTVWASGT